MIDPTVGQIFETFTESEKEALYTITNAAIDEVYYNKSKVIQDSARLLKYLPETKKKVAYFLVGECLEFMKEREEK